MSVMNVFHRQEMQSLETARARRMFRFDSGVEAAHSVTWTHTEFCFFVLP